MPFSMVEAEAINGFLKLSYQENISPLVMILHASNKLLLSNWCMCVCVCVCVCLYIYIYIYIERERERDLYIYDLEYQSCFPTLQMDSYHIQGHFLSHKKSMKIQCAWNVLVCEWLWQLKSRSKGLVSMKKLAFSGGFG